MAHMKHGTRRALTATLIPVAVALAVLAAWLAARTLGKGYAPTVATFAVAGLALIGAFGLWHAFALVDRHFRALERLRGAMVMLLGQADAVLPLHASGEVDAEVERLYKVLADLRAHSAARRARPDERLAAVLASVTEALVVVTDQGQVSLVNYPAKVLLDAVRVGVGTSVFAALRRGPVVDAMARARSEGNAVTATLRTVGGRELHAKVASLGIHGGAVLSFSGAGAQHRAELEHDLGLHDRPPPVRPLDDSVPLNELHVTVMDTETTGLDPALDRVVSIGAVRVVGGRIYRGAGIDRLINPGRPIAPRSIAVHGITDDMVTDAADFATIYAEYTALAEGTVVVGHNVPFDIAMLRRECELGELPWRQPPYLDTLLLAAAMDLPVPGLSLETLAEYFAVDVHGRHTALGDALVTAEIYVRMIPTLREAGVRTFGEAVAFSQKATDVIAEQHAAGW